MDGCVRVCLGVCKVILVIVWTLLICLTTTILFFPLVLFLVILSVILWIYDSRLRARPYLFV